MEGSHLLHSHNASLNKPLNSPRSESCTPLEVTVASSKRWLAIYSLLFVVAYLVLGVTVYTTLSGMSALDSLYFCIGERNQNNVFGFQPLKKMVVWYVTWYGILTVWCMVHGTENGTVYGAWYSKRRGVFFLFLFFFSRVYL